MAAAGAGRATSAARAARAQLSIQEMQDETDKGPVHKRRTWLYLVPQVFICIPSKSKWCPISQFLPASLAGVIKDRA